MEFYIKKAVIEKALPHQIDSRCFFLRKTKINKSVLKTSLNGCKTDSHWKMCLAFLSIQNQLAQLDFQRHISPKRTLFANVTKKINYEFPCKFLFAAASHNLISDSTSTFSPRLAFNTNLPQTYLFTSLFFFVCFVIVGQRVHLMRMTMTTMIHSLHFRLCCFLLLVFFQLAFDIL